MDWWASWDLQIDSPGKYALEVMFSNEARDTEYVVSVGDQQLSGQFQRTRSWVDDFVVRKVGVLSLAEPGRYTLSLKPKIASQPMAVNLERITLRPVR